MTFFSFNKMRAVVCLTLLLNWSICSGQAVPSNVSAKIQQIESGLLPILIVEGDTVMSFTLQDRMKHYNVPGVSVAVIRNGKIEWAKGYGFADREAKRTVDTSTLFQAASISKPVAALAALHWVEAGKLALDKDINTYLNGWKIPDTTFTKTEKVTLRRLMTHTAGLTVHGFAGYAKGRDVPTITQILNGQKPANSRPVLPDTIPGIMYRYSGGGYTVMQKAMIDQLGKPFPEIMQETVLSKLNMKHSTYQQPLPAKFDSIAATAYLTNGQPVNGLWHTYPEMAAAGLWTTPSDLARYVIDVQQTVNGKSSRVISKQMAEQMLTKQVGGAGLGPALRNAGDSLIFSHNGANEGFRCLFVAHAYKPDGVVIMTNSDNGTNVAQELLNSISAAYGWDFGRPRRITPAKLDATQLERLKGRYLRDRYIFDVEITNGRTYAIPRWENQTQELIPQSSTQFIMRDGQKAEFVVESDSTVSGVKLFNGIVFKKTY